MRGTSCVETFGLLAMLPAEALMLFDAAPGCFAGRAWWDVVLAHAVPAGAEASFLTVRSAGRVVAVLPMLRQARRLSSLTTPYSCEFVPLFAAGLDQATRVAAMAAFGTVCRRTGIVRLDALPVEWPNLADFEAGIRRAGLLVLRFDHFGNWYEDVGGLDWSGYLLGRTGALRETIRRRLRRAEKLANARFELMTRPDEMDRAAEAFEIGLPAKLERAGTVSDVQCGADAGDGGERAGAVRRVVNRDGAGRSATVGRKGGACAGAETGARRGIQGALAGDGADRVDAAAPA